MLGNYNGGDVAMNYIYNSKYSVNFGFSVASKTVSNQTSELLKSAKISSTDIKISEENLENFHLMIGRVIKLSPKKNTRIIIQAGPGVSTIREPVFMQNKTGFPNSQIGFRRRQQVSLMINPKIEFPLTYILGFSVGPILIVNDERCFFGATLGFYMELSAKNQGKN